MKSPMHHNDACLAKDVPLDWLASNAESSALYADIE